MTRREGRIVLISTVPDQTTLISGGKGQIFTPAASTVAQPSWTLKLKRQQKHFFCLKKKKHKKPTKQKKNPFSSYFLPLYKWKRRLFALLHVCLCLTADQWEKKIKQRNKFKTFRKHIFEYLHFLHYQYVQLFILMQNMSHSRLWHTV